MRHGKNFVDTATCHSDSSNLFLTSIPKAYLSKEIQNFINIRMSRFVLATCENMLKQTVFRKYRKYLPLSHIHLLGQLLC